MNALMTNCERIMDDVVQALLLIPEGTRCDDSEVMDVINKFKKVLSTFDKIFSMARKKSGLFEEEDKVRLDLYVKEGMRLWREMDLSMEAPKVHAIQDHLCDQLMQFKGIGDLSEDFVEQAHQDGIRDNRRTNSLKDRAVVAAIHSKWEHKRKLPSVLMKSEAVGRRSVRTRRTLNDDGITINMPISEKDEKKKALSEQKEILRTIAMESIRSTVGSFFQTGRQKNLIAASSRMQEAPRFIINMGRVLLAKITVRKMKKPIEKINKGVRIFLAKIRRNRIR